MNEVLDIVSLAESVDLECKAAQGRDGKGELPSSFWETYCAMANSNGGEVYLGIEETTSGEFTVVGIKDADRVKKSLWDTLHAKNKVSRNILNDSDVSTVTIDEKQIIRIAIPRARRQERPVYLGANPFGNTYLRRHEGDYKADDETVRRMLAECVEDSRDELILEYFTIADLEKDTISAYRNRFSAVKPDSPWLDLPTEEFLNRIGAIGTDRATGKFGLRIAGLLMFGRFDAIREVFPNYMVDFQERPEPKTEARWVDRLVPDSTWSGNLYDFFQKVYRKLTADIKIPFRLREGMRTDDTPVHESIREALTNTLIHADYTGRVSVLVVKRPDMFGFRNPGLMRVAVEQAVHGGISDCRNRRIQDMFRYVGLGDHAGSGIPKIYRNWNEQHWRLPLLYENQQYEQTLLELRMISLLPEESIRMLDELFGDQFRELPELERVILITAATEGFVQHTRIKEISLEHSKDITSALAHLVQKKMLEKEGETRGSIYHLPGKQVSDATPLFLDNMDINSPDLSSNSPDLSSNSPDLSSNSPDLKNKLSLCLQSIGYTKMPKKISYTNMKKIILEICEDHFLSIKDLADLLERDAKALQDRYITSFVAEDLLELKYPDTKNHPDQAYRSKK
jgi:ATP-dependent DNA helicase RecG